MYDILPQKGCVETRDLFKFWEISNNISETVQDIGIVTMEHYWEIVLSLSNGTIANPLNDLEGHFFV